MIIKTIIFIAVFQIVYTAYAILSTKHKLQKKTGRKWTIREVIYKISDDQRAVREFIKQREEDKDKQ